MKRNIQEIAIFNLEYFLRFENFPGRAYRVTANFSVIIIIRWMFHQWCSVSPFFPRRFVPPRLPGSGSAETHFPSEEKRKNDATSIDQNRMTPREKSSPDGNGTRGKCFFFFPLFLSHPLCATNSPHSAVRPSFSSFALNGFSGDSFLSLSSLVGYPPRSNETREIVSLIRGFDIRGET